MKKFVAILLVLMFCVSLVACGNKDDNQGASTGDNYTPSGEVVANDDYFEWSQIDDTQIVGYTEKGLKQEELIIPEKCTSVQGLENNPTVKYIKFENDDTAILSTTFSECTALQTIELPANLSEIENDVFNGCTSLKKITIPAGVTEIGSNTFADCSALATVELSSNLQVIGRKAFTDCTSLSTISFGNSVTDIEKSAFENCIALEKIEFGSGLKNIGESAFQKCSSLTSINVPEGVLTLEIYAFAHCDALESIYLPASIEMAEISSIVQTHKIKVYVVQGSYMDGRIAELMGVEFYDKQYQ